MFGAVEFAGAFVGWLESKTLTHGSMVEMEIPHKLFLFYRVLMSYRVTMHPAAHHLSYQTACGLSAMHGFTPKLLINNYPMLHTRLWHWITIYSYKIRNVRY
jgi:hypothetical protein